MDADGQARDRGAEFVEKGVFRMGKMRLSTASSCRTPPKVLMIHADENLRARTDLDVRVLSPTASTQLTKESVHADERLQCVRQDAGSAEKEDRSSAGKVSMADRRSEDAQHKRFRYSIRRHGRCERCSWGVGRCPSVYASFQLAPRLVEAVSRRLLPLDRVEMGEERYRIGTPRRSSLKTIPTRRRGLRGGPRSDMTAKVGPRGKVGKKQSRTWR